MAKPLAGVIATRPATAPVAAPSIEGFLWWICSTRAHDTAAAAPAPVFVDMPDLLVNLRSDSPRLRYLKLRLSLEVDGEPMAEGVRRLMPRIMDSFQLYLRALSLEDVQGAPGMQRLKEELGARARLAAAPAQIVSVLLKEMLVQ